MIFEGYAGRSKITGNRRGVGDPLLDRLGPRTESAPGRPYRVAITRGGRRPTSTPDDGRQREAERADDSERAAAAANGASATCLRRARLRRSHVRRPSCVGRRPRRAGVRRRGDPGGPGVGIRRPAQLRLHHREVADRPDVDRRRAFTVHPREEDPSSALRLVGLFRRAGIDAWRHLPRLAELHGGEPDLRDAGGRDATEDVRVTDGEVDRRRVRRARRRRHLGVEDQRRLLEHPFEPVDATGTGIDGQRREKHERRKKAEERASDGRPAGPVRHLAICIVTQWIEPPKLIMPIDGIGATR